MQIRWANVFAFVIVLAALIVVLTRGEEVFALLGTIGDIGPGHTDEEKVTGLIVLTLVGVVVVVIARVLTGRQKGGSR